MLLMSMLNMLIHGGNLWSNLSSTALLWIVGVGTYALRRMPGKAWQFFLTRFTRLFESHV